MNLLPLKPPKTATKRFRYINLVTSLSFVSLFVLFYFVLFCFVRLDPLLQLLDNLAELDQHRILMCFLLLAGTSRSISGEGTVAGQRTEGQVRHLCTVLVSVAVSDFLFGRLVSTMAIAEGEIAFMKVNGHAPLMATSSGLCSVRVRRERDLLYVQSSDGL